MPGVDWFAVDKKGLAKLLEHKGKAFALFELIQNAWDQKVTAVNVRLNPIEGKSYAEIEVTDDDPDGFKDLTHAFTLFAESNKKKDATKRGRFNLGEKLVLAMCKEAEILSTTGGVSFDENGRHALRNRLNAGSKFWGILRMTRDEFNDASKQLRTLIPPVPTTFNDQQLPTRIWAASKEAALPTLISDDEGVLRQRERVTRIEMYEPLPGETAHLYEMGIPVVETGDRWHVNICQKVPLNMDRDNVTPRYLRLVRVHALNAMHSKISTEDANAPWARDAMGSPLVKEEAVRTVVEKRFGSNRVVFDPSDAEANKIAVTKGYTVIHGSMLAADEWANVKKAQAALPAGQVTPSPKPFHPGGKPLKTVPLDELTPAMERFISYALALGRLVLRKELTVIVACDAGWNFQGAYGSGQLYANVGGKNGAEWIEHREQVNRFLIHEYSHEYSGDHLSHEFHDALCRVGAKIAELAYKDEVFFSLLDRP